MTVKWLMITSVPAVFILGALACINPAAAVTTIVVCILATVAIWRFRPQKFTPMLSGSALQTDWVVLLIPTVLAIRAQNTKVALLAIGLLTAVTLIRKGNSRFRIAPAPFVLLLVASTIVLIRPENTSNISAIFTMLTFGLVAVLVLRVVTTVDARTIIASLIDGCGVYCAANLALFIAGMRSPAADLRIGGLVETTGYIRTIYPLTTSLNTPPVIAAVYLVAVPFLLIRDRNGLRRFLRIVLLLAAFIILGGAGSRLPVLAGALIVFATVCFPPISRWLAQATVLLAATSAFVLPGLLKAVVVPVEAFTFFTPGRAANAGSIATMQGRDEIWRRSITYWAGWIDDPVRRLFGFGVEGQYRSGASYSYRELLGAISRTPERASVHNSFLQQLFDGGLVGFALLAAALFWACARLANRRNGWGIWGLCAVVAMTVLTMSAVTEVSLAPGPAQDTFWLGMVLVGVACQTAAKQPETEAVTSASTAAYTLPPVGIGGVHSSGLATARGRHSRDITSPSSPEPRDLVAFRPREMPQ